ncbi:YqaJ viral recombinase family protein [Streptomyces scopuliridis]|uniref:YqaJ viral recombinase family nuclease n=1 Tax=Streptomyces scopuliridis TaxID=452529 RepID=UPI0036806C92
MTDIATPTGILLGRYTPGTPEWDQARAGLTITATEIAAVMGLSPWMSRFSLWHKKAGLPTPPFQANPAMEWGNRLEDAVARKYADEHGAQLASTGTWRHAEREWQRATPDRLLVASCDCGLHQADCCDPKDCGPCCERCPTCLTLALPPSALLEVKTSPFGDGWGPSGSDEIPVHYRCQVQWQLDTLGLKTCHVALLIGGWDYREYVIEYDETDAKVMRGAAERFLDDVRRGVRPPIDGADATYQTIRVQPNGREDVDVEIPLGLAVRFDLAQEQAKSAGEELTAARGEVLDCIGGGHRAVCEGRRIAYRTVNADGTTHALQPYRSTAA